LEEFGMQLPSDVLTKITPEDSASDIASSVIDATDSHAGAGVNARDDRTLVVFRVTDHTSSDFSKLPIIY
jgi:hypothetical protein